MIFPVNEVDYNSSFNNIEKRNNFVGNTLTFSPMYIAMYKVWEGKAKDNIITEVIGSITCIRSIINHIQFSSVPELSLLRAI